MVDVDVVAVEALGIGIEGVGAADGGVCVGVVNGGAVTSLDGPAGDGAADEEGVGTIASDAVVPIWHGFEVAVDQEVGVGGGYECCGGEGDGETAHCRGLRKTNDPRNESRGVI